MYALDAATGKEVWRCKTGDDAEIHNHVGIQASPAVADGSVFFGCRDSNVYAVDAKTGKQKWFYSTKGSWVNNSAAVYDGKVYFGISIPGLLHAVPRPARRCLLSIPSSPCSPRSRFRMECCIPARSTES